MDDNSSTGDFGPLAYGNQRLLQALQADDPPEDVWRHCMASNSKSSSSSTTMPYDYHNHGGNAASSSTSSSTNATLPFLKAGRQMVVHQQSRPLPTACLQAIKRMRQCMNMGVFSNLQLAWLTVDHQFFVWSLLEDDNDDSAVTTFVMPHERPIVQVVAVPPKEGIFRADLLTTCLAMATPEQVLLCGLVLPQRQVIPTRFVWSIANTITHMVVDPQTCHIWVTDHQGQLMELEYEMMPQQTNDLLSASSSPQQVLQAFYHSSSSENNTEEEILIGNGRPALTALAAAGVKRLWEHAHHNNKNNGNGGLPPTKTRKILHGTSSSSSNALFSSNKQVVTSILPAPLATLWTAWQAAPVQALKFDEQRRIMMVLHTNGKLHLYQVGNNSNSGKTRSWMLPSNSSNTTKHLASLDCVQAATAYLQAVRVGRFTVSSSASVQLGSNAADGVGGMAGARTLLKWADNNKNALLVPTRIVSIPPSASSSVLAVAVTACGLRYSLAWQSNKLVLTHIRLPPEWNPLSTTTTLCLPRIPTLASDLPKVDGCVWAPLEGIGVSCVLPSTTPANAPRPSLAATLSKSTPYDNVLIVSSLTGGNQEGILYPMAHARFGDDKNNKMNTTLPGGRVWDVQFLDQQQSHHQDGVWALMEHAPSKRRSTLIPPAYLVLPATAKPKSKEVATPAPSSNNNKVLSSSLTTNLKPKAAFVAKVVTNLVLLRPAYQGVDMPGIPKAKPPRPSYKLSERSGVHGFSSTAMEGRRKTIHSRKASSTKPLVAKSARLAKDYLQPDASPVHPLAVQHLMRTPGTLVAMNVGGIHVFGVHSVLEQFAHSLARSGVHAAHDPAIHQYFVDYGFKEACAMCIFLAIGSIDAATANVQAKATQVLFAKAHSPKLQAAASTTGAASTSSFSFGGNSNTEDPLIPRGYSFVPSKLCAALGTVVARLVRPIWNKPAVVVTEGRVLRTSSHKTRVTPAKVELLLDDETLVQLQRPLQELANFLKTHLERAVVQVPAGTSSSNADAMQIDGADGLFPGQEPLLTIAQVRMLQEETEGQVQVLSRQQAQDLAQSVEERMIHSYYRIVSRASQLLTLLSILKEIHCVDEASACIEWGLLHGISFQDLVVSPKAHDRFEALFNKASATTTSSSAASGWANNLTKHCYLYYSPSWQHSQMAFGFATEALEMLPGSARRSALAHEAARHFMAAAPFWHSPVLITGRVLPPAPDQPVTYEEIVANALKHDSPVARAAELLVALEMVQATVEVCLLTARNFDQERSNSALLPIAGNGDASLMNALPWEQGLYHSSRRPASSSTPSASTALTTTSTSPGGGLFALGASITANDALEVCHAILFCNVDRLLRSQDPSLGETMISECVSVGGKPFLFALFDYMVVRNHKDTVFRIQSNIVEEWLMKRGDPMDTWNHLMIMGRYKDAGNLIVQTEESAVEMDLSTRLQFLCNALASFEKLGDSEEKKQAETRLTLLKIQERILKALQSGKYEATDDREEQIARLSKNALDVSTLYNDFAVVMSLYDECLCILKAVDYKDTQAIEDNWIHFLEQEASDLTILESRLVELGKELYAPGSPFFPVDFLVEKLEVLSKAVQTPDADWPKRILYKVGVPFLYIMNAYDSMLRHESQSTMGGVPVARQLQLIGAQVDILQEWARQAAASNASAAAALGELQAAMHSGALTARLEAYKIALGSLAGSTEVQGRLMAVQGEFGRILSGNQGVY